MSGPGLSAADRDIVRAAVQAEAGVSHPRDLSAPGCLLFVLSLVMFILIPRLALRWPDVLTRSVRLGLFALIVVGLLAGLTLAFLFGGGRGRKQAQARAEAAVEHLASRFGENRRADLEAAARLVVNAFFSGGPWTVGTIDIETARERLGQAEPLVREVERAILEDSGGMAVFT